MTFAWWTFARPKRYPPGNDHLSIPRFWRWCVPFPKVGYVIGVPFRVYGTCIYIPWKSKWSPSQRFLGIFWMVWNCETIKTKCFSNSKGSHTIWYGIFSYICVSFMVNKSKHIPSMDPMGFIFFQQFQVLNYTFKLSAWHPGYKSYLILGSFPSAGWQWIMTIDKRPLWYFYFNEQ